MDLKNILKTALISMAFILVFLGIPALWFMNKYNDLVTEQENVEAKWSQVEVQYQQRLDMIPNLVATVKGYAAHESATLEAVVAQRAGTYRIDIASATDEEIAAYAKAQREIGAGIGRLMAVAEAYPELKASDSFRDLQSQIEGQERRIAHARFEFNEEAKHYNAHIRKFPAMLIARAFGMERRPYFEAEDAAAQAPEVAF